LYEYLSLTDEKTTFWLNRPGERTGERERDRGRERLTERERSTPLRGSEGGWSAHPTRGERDGCTDKEPRG